MNPRPIVGVFDSGVGGLSILHEIRRELPSVDLIYLADSEYAPYGDRSSDEIEQRASAATDFLVSQGAEAIVAACNTATELAVDALRARHDIPIVGIEPAVKPAVAMTQSGVVGVLATSQTLSSAKYARLVAENQGANRILSQPCPGLVERVEAGELDTPSTSALVSQYLRPIVEYGADVVVLGCTHYPFLLDLFAAEAGPGVTILESAAPVARQLRRRLNDAGLDLTSSVHGTEQFWTTGDVDRVGSVISRLWGRTVVPRAVPEPWRTLNTPAE